MRPTHTSSEPALFDQIDALPSDLQKRALRDPELSSTGLKPDSRLPVRVLAATTVSALVDQHQFRRDLCIRLKMMVLSVPPLRNRKEDIPLLAHHFFAKLSKAVGERSLLRMHLRYWRLMVGSIICGSSET